MPMASFDTISVAKRLEEEFAMPRQQAEGVAVVMHENLVGNLATKDDVKALKDDIKALKDDMKALDEKVDTSVNALNEKIDVLAETQTEMRTDLKWIQRIGGVIVTLLILPLLTDLVNALLN